MLRIRLSRTGKNSQPSYRVVAIEKTMAAKGKCVENLGFYLPARKPEILELKKERIEYWLSKGAQPTDTVAVLLKNAGFAKMESFIEPRDKQRKKKKGGEAAAEGAQAAKAAPAAAPKEAPKAEEKPVTQPTV